MQLQDSKNMDQISNAIQAFLVCCGVALAWSTEELLSLGVLITSLLSVLVIWVYKDKDYKLRVAQWQHKIGGDRLKKDNAELKRLVKELTKNNNESE